MIRPISLIAPLCFLAFYSCTSSTQLNSQKSLTDDSFTGKKYFFSWAEPLAGAMGNEVRFDVRHMHHVFANKWGGNYEAQALLSSDEVKRDTILAKLDDYGAKLTADDMYVQYSAGHGLPEGLNLSVSYDELKAKILTLKAKEIIIFTMSCYAGGLVESFNKDKALWENFQSQGRTLFVMASSEADKTSSTGPSVDQAEPYNVPGSAGSAFGYALWKALIGDADGYGGAEKDGKVTLGEIRGFVTEKTKALGGHTPVVTGVYDDNLAIATLAPALQVNPEWLAAKEASIQKEKELREKFSGLLTKETDLEKQKPILIETIKDAASMGLAVKIKSLSEERDALIQQYRQAGIPGGSFDGDPNAGEITSDSDISLCMNKLISDAFFDGQTSVYSYMYYAPTQEQNPSFAYCQKEVTLFRDVLAASSEELRQKYLTLLSDLEATTKEIASLRAEMKQMAKDLDLLLIEKILK